MKKLARELIAEIEAFDKACTEAEHTDVGEVWDLVSFIKAKLTRYSEERLTEEQVEDLAGSVCDCLLIDPSLLRDVCLAYARTFSAADYKGWFGKEKQNV